MSQRIREKYSEKRKGALDELKEKSEGLIESQGSITAVKEILRATQTFDILTRHFDVDTVRKFEEHTKAKEAYDTLVITQIEKNISTGTSSSVAQDILRDYKDGAQEEEDALAIIAENEPTLARAHKLLSYKEALSKEGHICPLPSTVEYIRKIEDRMITGKPVFLHGATGTGKTSLARYAAKELTGKEAEMVSCSPQFREKQVWSTTGLKATEDGRGVETVAIYGHLSRAIQEGKAIIFDEFTTLPKEQMAFIKGVFNKKIGDTVTVPGNGKIVMQEGFQMIFTANLKSEKNQERSDLPPEMASEFEQNNIEIGYASTEEMYDTMLARLMDKKGNLTLSYEDLQDTLPRFVSAIKEVQVAYSGVLPDDEAKKLGVMEANGRTQGLKKFVMSQRSIEAILERWKVEHARDEQANFRNFLDDALQTGVTFKEYPEADRALVAKIFATKGFLKTKSESELGLKSGSLKGLLTHGEYEETKKQTLSIKDVAGMDPFNARKSQAQEDAESFLKEEEERAPDSTELEPTLACLRDAGYLDSSFEGKETHSLAMRALSKEDAFAEYKKSGGKTWWWGRSDQEDLSYATPNAENLDVMIMKFVGGVRGDDAILEMDKLGVRPLTLEELIQYGIAHPAHQKQNSLLALGSKYTFNSTPRVPFLCGSSDDEWYLSINYYDGVWDDTVRFLVVRTKRKSHPVV